MRTHLAVLAFISIVCDLHIGYGATSSILTSEQGAIDQDTPARHKSLAPSSAPLATENSGGQQETASPDCEGKAPATGSVTALLSKLVRSSSVTRGVQCPIPLVPEPSTTQEMNR